MSEPSALYTDIDPYCCAVLGSRVEDGSLPPGDVMLADVRDLNQAVLSPYRHVHLFCGIGGFPLGLAWAEWPAAVSVVTGGFPCQDISLAGNGAGLSGERSGLFWEMQRVIRIKRPDIALCENVGALSVRGMDVVAAAMESCGYCVCDPVRVGAWAVGAPHQRERWWIVCKRQEDADTGENGCRAVGISHVGTVADQSVAVGRAVANAAKIRDQQISKGSRHQGERASDAAGTGAAVQSDADQDAVLDSQAAGSMCARVAAGWASAPAGPWRRVRDEWQYAGPPSLVYSGGSGCWQRDASAVSGGAGHAAGRPDPTCKRGWPVPVLPGYQQKPWEFERIHQRGVGDAVHGLPRRLAATLNRCGVMALGNAVVPQVVAAIARGVVRAITRGRE